MLRKGKTVKKKIITTSPSKSDFKFPIDKIYSPEKYKMMDDNASINTCLMVSLSIIIRGLRG